AYPEEYGIAYWAKIIKAASWEELDRLTEGNEVLEDMTETMRKLAEDQREQWILQQREFYGYEMASQYHGGYNDGVADQKIETDKANRRADEAEQRADEAERRAEELANELAALKVKHGS
ncbi:MAG: hypothetical protein Q4E57_02530, partial [Eubacteriales bacterium]|nr:hypothetical protein [Eubacteriales bacterium]